jgi:hypothetical protein
MGMNNVSLQRKDHQLLLIAWISKSNQFILLIGDLQLECVLDYWKINLAIQISNNMSNNNVLVKNHVQLKLMMLLIMDLPHVQELKNYR